MTRPPTSDEAAQFSRLMQGHIAMRLLLMAGRIGLIKLLADGPLHAEELAELTGLSSQVMPRILRAMSSIGVLEVKADGRYVGTGMLGMIDMLLAPGFDESSYIAWGHADHTLRTGEPAWDQVFGKPFYDSLDPNQLEAFNVWNTRATVASPPIAAMSFWSKYREIVDVGGGQGALIADILAANPGMKGHLLDRPESLRDAPVILQQRKVSDRCVIQPGNFFQEVPKGGDAYILSRVLLNWNDEKCLAILESIANATEEGATLVVIDLIIPPVDHPAYCFAVMNDLNLLVNFGGATRSESELRKLIEMAPFRVTHVEIFKPPSLIGIIIAQRKSL